MKCLLCGSVQLGKDGKLGWSAFRPIHRNRSEAEVNAVGSMFTVRRGPYCKRLKPKPIAKSRNTARDFNRSIALQLDCAVDGGPDEHTDQVLAPNFKVAVEEAIPACLLMFLGTSARSSLLAMSGLRVLGALTNRYVPPSEPLIVFFKGSAHSHMGICSQCAGRLT